MRVTGLRMPKKGDSLIVAGIPEPEHSVESLTARMPEGLSAHPFQGMSADIVAEVLLYFIAKGLVTIPVSVDKALLDMPLGVS